MKNSIKTSLIPIIVISGSIDPEIISNVKNLGADEFISKPPDLDQLLGLLRRLLPGATASQAEGSRLK